MFRSGCCLASSVGCLVIGLVIGAVLVWLFFPYLQEKGYVPENFRADAIRISESASKSAAEIAEQLRKNESGEKKSDINQAGEEAGEPAPEVRN